MPKKLAPTLSDRVRDFFNANRNQAYSPAYVALCLVPDAPPVRRVANILKDMSAADGSDILYLGHGSEKDSAFFSHRDYSKAKR